MAKMRAVQVARAGGPLELLEREMPEPARGEVRVASRLAAYATAIVSPLKVNGPASRSLAFLGTRSLA